MNELDDLCIVASANIKSHITKVLTDYLNSVKSPSKTKLNKSFIPDNDNEFIRDIEILVASSYLLGIYHAGEEVPGFEAADTDIPPIEFASAKGFLRDKVSMPKSEWLKLEQQARFRAFTVAKLGDAKMIEDAKNILVKSFESGENYAETWEKLKQQVNVNPFKVSPGYWENVFRTNTQSAYVAGKLDQYNRKGVQAYQLMVIEDSRTSDICRNLLRASGYGVTLPVKHEFWEKYGFPPYHYQCRTSIRAIWKATTNTTNNKIYKSKLSAFKDFKPLEGFGGNPFKEGRWWKLTSSQKEFAKKVGLTKVINDAKKDIIKPIEEDKNKIIKSFDYFNKDLYSDKEREQFLADYEKITDDGKAFIEKYGAKMRMDMHITDGGCYRPWTNKIYVPWYDVDGESTCVGFKHNMTTFLHEYGHWFDYNIYGFGEDALRDHLPKLKDYLTQDVLNYTNSVLENVCHIDNFDRNTAKEKFYFKFVEDLISKGSYVNSSISDLFQGVTNSKIYDGWGHALDYWKKAPNRVEKEAIAEMFEAFCSGGVRAEAMKKFLPTAYNYFTDFIYKEFLND